MKNKRLLLIIALLTSLMLACDLATGLSTPPTPIVVVVTQLVAADTALPQAQPTATEAPTATALPVETAITAPTPTSSIPMVTPLKDPVNCRYGPSVNYEQVFALAVGAYAQVTGKSADGGWWQVLAGEGSSQNCWVANSVVSLSGDPGSILPVPAPAAFVTNASFQVKPDSINLGPGCVGPYPNFSLKGTISTNGPLEVKWRIETQQDGFLTEHSFSFSKFGQQDISYNYVPSYWKKGNFWVRLIITSPQNMTYEATYRVKCE